MKKIYINPTIDIHDINSSDIICISTHFGEGNTNLMHTKDAGANFDDIIEYYVEQ